MKLSVIKKREGLSPEKFARLVEAIGFQESLAMLETHFHPQGLFCHECGSRRRVGGGKTVKGMPRYRCAVCGITYTVLSGTIFSGSKMGPKEIVLFMWLLSIKADDGTISKEVGIGIPAVRIMQQKIALYGQQ